jgi:hypothetical protein
VESFETRTFSVKYSHLCNSRRGGNNQGVGTKVVKSIKMEEGINEEVGSFGKYQ